MRVIMRGADGLSLQPRDLVFMENTPHSRRYLGVVESVDAKLGVNVRFFDAGPAQWFEPAMLYHRADGDAYCVACLKWSPEGHRCSDGATRCGRCCDTKIECVCCGAPVDRAGVCPVGCDERCDAGPGCFARMPNDREERGTW